MLELKIAIYLTAASLSSYASPVDVYAVLARLCSNTESTMDAKNSPCSQLYF